MKKPHTWFDDRIYRELFLTSSIASYVCDRDGYIVEFNAAAELLWGRRPITGEEKWSGASAFYHPDGQPMLPEATPMATAIRDQADTSGQELVIVRPDGSRRVVLAFPKLIRTEAGGLIGAHNALVDITEFKQYEEKQIILSEIVQSSDDAIVSKNLDGTIMSWNHGAERI